VRDDVAEPDCVAVLEQVDVRLAVAVLISEGVPVADFVADTDADSLAAAVIDGVLVGDGDVVTRDVLDRVGVAESVPVAVIVELHHQRRHNKHGRN